MELSCDGSAVFFRWAEASLRGQIGRDPRQIGVITLDDAEDIDFAAGVDFYLETDASFGDAASPGRFGKSHRRAIEELGLAVEIAQGENHPCSLLRLIARKIRHHHAGAEVRIRRCLDRGRGAVDLNVQLRKWGRFRRGRRRIGRRRWGRHLNRDGVDAAEEPEGIFGHFPLGIEPTGKAEEAEKHHHGETAREIAQETPARREQRLELGLADSALIAMKRHLQLTYCSDVF